MQLHFKNKPFDQKILGDRTIIVQAKHTVAQRILAPDAYTLSFNGKTVPPHEERDGQRLWLRPKHGYYVVFDDGEQVCSFKL